MQLKIVTPAGRRKYLELLRHYVLGSPEVAEWQLWDNCRNEEDRAYLHALAASDPRCRLKQLPGADGGWGVIGEFFRFCDDPDALYLRLDDDIVFLEPGFFPKFIARANEERGKALWFSPLVINNAICTWLLKFFSRVLIDGPVTCQAMCPYSWAYPALPEALHPVFIEAVRNRRLDDFRVADHEVRLSRFSINAYGFFGADRVSLGERFIAPDGNEEEWLSAVLPAMVGRPGRIFGGLIAAHFSFYTQERDLLLTDILEDYYRLAGLAPPARERPRARSAWRRLLAREKMRGRVPPPRYRVGLREGADPVAAPGSPAT
ncbi:MAG: hypothetical protein IT535_01990 [Bauldia sp.]|nr:hypothetical protein [Bauldia sp.]